MTRPRLPTPTVFALAAAGFVHAFVSPKDKTVFTPAREPFRKPIPAYLVDRLDAGAKKEHGVFLGETSPGQSVVTGAS
ncbi:MAG: hypothetical protein ACRDF9_10560 [Candidatus Limnocylindria bacterium]